MDFAFGKSKDIDLWQVIQNGNFYFEVEDKETKLMKETLYELLNDTEKKQFGKNEEAKMTIYNALPRNEYERVVMCKTSKEFGIHLSSLIKAIHKSRIIRLIFSLKNMRSIQSLLKKLSIVVSLDLMLLAKVTVIEESKDLATLPLEELIGKLKVYEMVLDNDGVASKTTKEKVNSLALKAKVTRKQTSDNSTCKDESDKDKEINLMAKNFRKVLTKRCKVHDKFNICQVQGKGGESSRRERGCYNCDSKVHLVRYSQTSKTYIVLNKKTLKVKESINVTFDESLPKSRTSHLVDDDMIEEQAVQNHDRTQNPDAELEEDTPRVENIREIRDHPTDQVMGELDERTLRSHAQDRSNFFAFVSSIEPKNIKKAIKDESWTMAMQEELDYFVHNNV
nr:hypothetical protein [Tanacetum cinerariifolium]